MTVLGKRDMPPKPIQRESPKRRNGVGKVLLKYKLRAKEPLSLWLLSSLPNRSGRPASHQSHDQISHLDDIHAAGNAGLVEAWLKAT
jgi:hypothetical protein